MALELKRVCEKCGVALTPSGAAYICSYECTYCELCRANGRCLSKLRR
jgi:hypothetical protein